MTGEMDGEPQEEIIDQCVQRLLQGESLDHVLHSYPDQQLRLRAALQPALALLRSATPEPSPRARYAAMNAMLRQVRAEAVQPELPGVIRWLGSLRARPLAFQALAVIAAIAVFSGLGLGASAATGTAPEPVRNFLGISSTSNTVRVAGPIVSIESSMLVVRTADGDRSIEITSATNIRRGESQIDVTGLLAGETVAVTATESRDGTLIARNVRAAVPPAPTETPVIGAPSLPQSDDVATGTPSTEQPSGGEEHGDENHNSGPSSTPVPEDRHDDGEHTGTPESSSTSGSESTRTPDHEDATRTPDHEDATQTPTGGGDSEGHDDIIFSAADHR